MSRRGQHFRWNKRTTTDELATLDAQKFAKSPGFARHEAGLWRWQWTSGQESSISYEVKPGQGVRLDYKSNDKPFDYLVRLVTTPCHFGGVRYWWLCPNCGRRCRILYCCALFVCRQCSGAYYGTQASKDIAVRIDNELRRLRAKLGAKRLSSNEMPSKPKRMHWQTYSKIAKRIFNLQKAEEVALLIPLIAYAEMEGISEPGRAENLKGNLCWLMRQAESNT